MLLEEAGDYARASKGIEAAQLIGFEALLYLKNGAFNLSQKLPLVPKIGDELLVQVVWIFGQYAREMLGQWFSLPWAVRALRGQSGRKWCRLKSFGKLPSAQKLGFLTGRF